jgi:hypothetical protein
VCEDEADTTIASHLAFANGLDSLRIHICRESSWDTRLDLDVRSHGFAGHGSCWIDREAFRRFARNVVQLAQSCNGKAELHAISPEKFMLTIRSISSRGHFAVEGRICETIYAQDHEFSHSVTFGFEIELSQVDKAAKVFQRAASDF